MGIHGEVHLSVSYWPINELINAVGVLLISYKMCGHDEKLFFWFPWKHMVIQ